MKYIAIFAFILVFLSSCSEDPVTSTPDTKPYIEVTPDSLVGVTYTYYDFKARLHNFPFDNVRYTWYFGEGDTLLKNVNSTASWRYDKPGNYTLSIIAHDLFADTIVAVKHSPITITDAKPYVTISPTTKDTTVIQQINGDLSYINFTANTNLPNDKAVFHWHFPPKTPDSVITYFNTVGYLFPITGTYQVVVDVYDICGNFWASDSTTITIRTEQITPEMIANSQAVQVCLYSSRVFQDSLDLPASIISGVREGKNKSTTYSITGGSIACNTQDTLLYGKMARVHSTNVKGNFSSNLLEIKSLSVSNWDSSYQADTLVAGNISSYDLTDLSLVSVTDEYIVYAAYKKPFYSYAHDIRTEKLPKAYYIIYDYYGQLDDKPFGLLGYAYCFNVDEYAVVIFSRK